MGEAPRKIEPANGLDELKTLLFQNEEKRLAAVETRVSRIDGRVGDAPHLERATAEILVEALRRAEVERHRELADAVAPVVVAAIRNEIRNSREMIVEALYPLTGQLVVAAVQNAFRELIASLNQRLDALTSFDRYKLALQSKISGKPVSELALAHTARGRVSRALFLETGSGRLIASWRADGREDERADMVGGLIAAITGFARDALDAGANELRTLDFGGRQTYLRNSAQTIVAAECEGELSRPQIVAFEAAFLDLVAANARRDEADENDLAAFAARVNDAGAPKRKKPWPLWVLAGALALGLMSLAWRAGTRWWVERKVEAAVADVLTQRAHLAPFSVALTVLHGENRVVVKGVLPSQADADALVAALRAPAGAYAVEPRFAFVTTNVGFEALERRAVAAAADIDALRRGLDEAGRQAAAARESTIAQTSEVRSRVETLAASAAPSAQVAELRERLEALTARSATTTQAVELQARLDALAGSAASAAQAAELRQRIEALSRDAASAAQVVEMQGRLDAMARAGAPASLVADLRARVDSLTAANRETERLNATVAEISLGLAALTARLDTPRARLTALVDGFAVFFSEGNALLHEAAVNTRLDAIADHLKRESSGVRVVGHTDASGPAARNLSLSRGRAEAVASMLAARGVERRRIVIVSRAASFPLNDQEAGNRERNRRVTFEPLYDHEDQP